MSSLSGEHYKKLVTGNKFRVAGVTLDLMRWREKMLTYIDVLGKALDEYAKSPNKDTIVRIKEELYTAQTTWHNYVAELGKSKGVDYVSNIAIGGFDTLGNRYPEGEQAQ